MPDRQLGNLGLIAEEDRRSDDKDRTDSSLLQSQKRALQIVLRTNLHFLKLHIQPRRTGIDDRQLIRREGIPEHSHQSDSREYLFQELQLLRALLRG
jgi:hypothetical protein